MVVRYFSEKIPLVNRCTRLVLPTANVPNKHIFFFKTRFGVAFVEEEGVVIKSLNVFFDTCRLEKGGMGLLLQYYTKKYTQNLKEL